MSRPYDRATLDFYASEAPVYAASGPGGASARLHGFLDRLTPGARILEPGCGGGRDAAAMLAAVFEVDATDGSPALVAEAEVRIGWPVRVMRFDELDAVAAYDAVWAHASLLHVPFDALPDMLAKIHRALKPGGWHFASFKAAGGYAGEAENGSGGRDALGVISTIRAVTPCSARTARLVTGPRSRPRIISAAGMIASPEPRYRSQRSANYGRPIPNARVSTTASISASSRGT